MIAVRPGVLTVHLKDGRVIGGRGFFGRVKLTKVDRPPPDLCAGHPLAGLAPLNAFQRPVDALVAGVLRRRGETQVARPIVTPVAVDVVNRQARPLAMNKSPNRMVRLHNMAPKEPALPVSLVHNVERRFPRVLAVPSLARSLWEFAVGKISRSALAPCETACLCIKVDKFAKADRVNAMPHITTIPSVRRLCNQILGIRRYTGVTT